MEELKPSEPQQPSTPPDDVRLPDLLPRWLTGIGRFVVELAEVVLISLAIILPIRYFLIQPFYVKGASMEPTFMDREYLIIDEISFRTRKPERGEVVVFRYPVDPRQYFIKRIIGLPGETVSIVNDSITIKNADHPDGVKLDESSYLSPSVMTYGDKSVKLGPDEYFVMGDNRTSSLDSRIFGPLKSSFIVGRVWIRGWPVDRFTLYGPDKKLQL